MWSDSVFASPRGSFERPVPPPVSAPDDTPVLTVSINCDWLPYIRGALMQLLLQSTWKDTPPGLDITQSRVWGLINIFEECGSATPPFVCVYDFHAAANGDPWHAAALGDLVSPFAHFQTGVGWSSVSSYEPGGSQYWQNVTVDVDMPGASEVGIVQVGLVSVTKGSNYAGNLVANYSGIVLYNSGSQVGAHLVSAADIPDGSSVFQHDFGGVTADRILLRFLFGVTQNYPADGLGFIGGVIVTGHAPDPACP